MNNDKINELWAQSIKTVEIPMPNEMYKLGEGIFRRYETYDHIKFAELIVEECMNICRECIKDGYDEAEEPRGRIKDRFGVEE